MLFIDLSAKERPVTTRYNTAALRDLISAALTEDEFTALAFDYFRPVANQFAAGQTRSQRVQLLIEYAERSGQMARLAALIQAINPARYREYADRLLAPDAGAAPAASPPRDAVVSYQATLTGSGAIAQGTGALAGSEGSIVVGGRDHVVQQGKYNIHIGSAQGVVIGDQAQVTNVFSDSPAAPPVPSGPSAQRHLRQQLVELQSRYEALSKRIAALDKDLGRTLDSEHRLALDERRQELVAEREQVAEQMAQIEEQLQT
jgi:hypothetical protein